MIITNMVIQSATVIDDDTLQLPQLATEIVGSVVVLSRGLLIGSIWHAYKVC